MSAKAFTFICGDDDYLVSERGKEWFAEQTKDIADDLSKEVVDGRAEQCRRGGGCDQPLH